MQNFPFIKNILITSSSFYPNSFDWKLYYGMTKQSQEATLAAVPTMKAQPFQFLNTTSLKSYSHYETFLYSLNSIV